MYHDQTQEIARLTGENAVLRGLLSQCADVLIHCEPEDSAEADNLAALRAAVHRALAPAKGDLL